MTIDGALAGLDGPLTGLSQAFDNLRWAAVQAQPAGEGHALVDHYGAIADDLCALLTETRATLTAARQPAARGDPYTAGWALLICQICCNRATTRFYAEAVAHEWYEALGTLRRRGGEWATWVEGLSDALDRCPAPLYEVGETLIVGWRAIVDWPPSAVVSVAAHNIQISDRHRREVPGDATDGGER